MAEERSRSGGIDNSKYLNVMDLILNKMNEISGAKATLEINTDAVDKALKKIEKFEKSVEGVNSSVLKMNKTLGKQGQMNYFATQEKMIEHLTDAWEAYNKAISDLEKKKQKGSVMRWANAYRAMDYEKDNIKPEIFKMADEYYASFNNKGGNSLSIFSVEELRKVFQEALALAYDIHKSDNYWPGRNGTKNAAKRELQLEIAAVEKQKNRERKTLSIKDLYDIDESGLKERILTLRDTLTNLDLKYPGRRGFRAFGKGDAQRYVEGYLELEEYLKKFGKSIPEELKDLNKAMLSSGRLTKAFEDIKFELNLDNPRIKKPEKGRDTRISFSAARNAVFGGDGKLSRFDRNMETFLDNAAGHKVAQRKASQGGSNPVEEVKETTRALGELKKALDAVNNSLTDGAKMLAGSSAAETAKETEDALKGQAKAQEEVNKLQGASNTDGIEQLTQAVKTLKELYDEANAALLELRKRQARLDGMHTKALNAYTNMNEAYNRSKNNNYTNFDKGLLTKDDFMRVIREAMKAKDYDKAAAYLDAGVLVGKKNEFLMPRIISKNKDGSIKDWTQELMERAERMYQESNIDIDSVNAELSDVNLLIMKKEKEVEELHMKLLLEDKASLSSKQELIPAWQNGLDEKEIQAVEAYIKRLKAILKDAYDAEKAVQEALGRLNEFKTGDIEKIMADATSKDAPISKMLGVMTGMPVNDNAARKKAIESINPEQYKLITQLAEAAKKELDLQSNDIKAKWNDMAEAMIGVDAFKEVKPMNQRYVVKELEGYADTAKDAIDLINKQWLFGKVDEEKFSGKYAKLYIAALDAAKELAESKRNAQVGEFDQDSIFSQFAEGQAALTQERVDQLHAEAALYDELIAKKMEYYGIKPKQGTDIPKAPSEESKPRQESHTTTSHSTTRPTVNGGEKTVTHTNESSSTTGGSTGVDSAIDGQNRLQGEMRETLQESGKTDDAIRKVGLGAQTGIMEGIGSGWIEYQKLIQETDKSILEFWADYNNLYRERDDDGNPFINWSDEENTLKRIGERLKEIYGLRSNANFEKIYGNEAVTLMEALQGAGHSVYTATNNKTMDKFFNNPNRFMESRGLLEESGRLNDLLPMKLDGASTATSADEIIAFINSLANSEQLLKEFKESLSSMSLEDLVSKFHELAGMEGTSERLLSIKDAIKAIVSTAGEIDEQRLAWLNNIFTNYETTSVEEKVGEISRLMDIIRNRTVAEEALGENIDNTKRKTEEQAQSTVDANNGVVRSIEEISAAYERMMAHSDKWDQLSIKRTLDNYIMGVGETESSRTALSQLKNAHEAYDNSIENNWDWEKQYEWAVRFVTLFESYKDKGGTETSLAKHEELYNRLKPLVVSYREELLKVLDFNPTGGFAPQDLNVLDQQMTDIEAKMKKVREDFAQLFTEPISNNGTEEYYNGLYSLVENIGQAALELKNLLSGLEIPETATNLTGRKFLLENQFSWIEQAVAGRKGSIQLIYDSIDFEALKAQRELEQKISARQAEITLRILGNADYKQYGDDTWLADYIERVKTSTDEIDVIYAEFEQKLAERKQRIIELELLESLKQSNKQEFISFLRGISPTGNEEYTKNFEKYVDVFNSITHEAESLSAAILKVKDDMASVDEPKYLDAVPEGWKKLEGAVTAPQGYEWWTNGASRFSNEYLAALIKILEETEEISNANKKVEETALLAYEAVDSIINISYRNGLGRMQVDLSHMLPSTLDDLKLLLKTIKMGDNVDDVDSNIKQVNDYIKEKIALLNRWLGRTEKDSGWDNIHNMFDAETFKTFHELSPKEALTLLTKYKGYLKVLYESLAGDISVPKEMKPAKVEFLELVKTGALDAIEAFTLLLEKIKEFYDTRDSDKSPILSGSNVGDLIADSLRNARDEAEKTTAAIDDVVYHAGSVSRLNKAETNGRFYGSNRGTGYFGTGHYFVDAATKHELMDNGNYSKLPFTSVDISKYDNLFDARNNDALAGKLHDFLQRLTRYTQGEDRYSVPELFGQFEDVFGKSVLSMNEFEARLSELKNYMLSSSIEDRNDSVSTQFMKSLGYGGVDTRGTRYADTRYGTVIYDLKEESILQANITDELEKQGDMLEKRNYAAGEVWDQNEDKRILGIIDEQKKRAEIQEEFKKIYDTDKGQKAEDDFDAAQSRLREIDNIIAECTRSIENAEKELRSFYKDYNDLFGDNMMPEGEDFDKEVEEKRQGYRERIQELQEERAQIEATIPALKERYETEADLSRKALELAKRNVEERYKSNETPVSSDTTGSLQREQSLQEESKTIDLLILEYERLTAEIDKVGNKTPASKLHETNYLALFDERKQIIDQLHDAGMTLENDKWIPDIINLRELYELLLSLIKSGDIDLINKMFSIDAKTNDDVETLRHNFEVLINTISDAGIDITNMLRSLFTGNVGWNDLLNDPDIIQGYLRQLNMSEQSISDYLSNLRLTSSPTPSPTVDQHKEETLAAEEAAKAEEDLKQKRDEAAQASKSQDISVELQVADTAHEAALASQEAADSYKNEAVAAEEAAKGNEDLAVARRNATENTPHGGKIDEILGLNGDTNNRRRIIGEVGAEGASETGYTATYELSKGLTKTEVYGVPVGGGDVQLIASREVVNYNVLLKDTLSLIRQLSVAEAALNLERKKGSGPEVISAIENQIEYYKREIATNNALALSYEDRSATISGDYTKEQYDADVRERTELIYLDTAKKSAQAILSEYNRQAKDIAKTNTYVTNLLENLKNILNRYDSSINPEAKKGITNQEDLNQFNELVAGLRNFLNGLKNASLNPEDANRIIEMFGDLKRLGDNLYEKGMAGTGDLSQLNIESQKSILSDRISTFISRARRSDADVSDVIAKANELRDSLSGMDFGQQVTDGFTKLKELRAELDSINEQYKTIQSEVFGKIDAVFEARSKLNIAEAALISGGETPTTVKNVTLAMEDLRVAEEAAAEAYVKLLEYFDLGYITEEQYLEAFNKFFSAGSDASVLAKEIALLLAHTKAVAELALSYIDLDNAKQKLDVSAMKNGGVADADTLKKYDEARLNNQRLLNELLGTFTQEDTDLLDKVKSDIAQLQRYRDNIGAIFALGEANNKYLNLDTQLAKGGTLGMGELSMALDNVKLKAIEAGDAFADLLKMLHEGLIDLATFDNIQQLFFSLDIQKGSIKARTENERAHIDAQLKLVDELIKSYEKLAAAEEKAQYGADAVARAHGQKEVDTIKARQGKIQGDLAGTLSYELAVNIHNAEKYHDLLASAYEQKRDAINFKGLAFDGTHDEKTWDTLINKALQYLSILNKQNTKKPLSVSEAKILAQLGDLYEQAGNKAATAGEKGKEFTAAMDLAKKVVKEQTISNYDSIFGKMDSASTDKPEEYNRLIGEIQKNIENLRNTDLGTDAWNEEIKRLEENLRSINTDLNAKPVDLMAKESLNRKMSDWIQKNGRAGEYADLVRRLLDNLANVTSAGDQDRIALGFERIKAAAADAGKVGQSFTAGLMKRFKSLGQYLLTYASFYRIIGTLKKAVSIVKELDSGLMEVRKVSTESLSTLQKWQQSTFKQADMVGGTATQIEKSTAAWIRLGKSFTEAQEAAQASVQLLNVSEFTNIDDATTSLVSMRQAFDDLTYGDFVDKLNAVGDNYSSATDQLAQGMQNVSSVLKTTGNDIDQSLALLTAAKIVGCAVLKYTSKNIFNCVDCLKAHSTITGKLRYDGLIMCA